MGRPLSSLNKIAALMREQIMKIGKLTRQIMVEKAALD
jgi:hypothetical protein